MADASKKVLQYWSLDEARVSLVPPEVVLKHEQDPLGIEVFLFFRRRQHDGSRA